MDNLSVLVVFQVFAIIGFEKKENTYYVISVRERREKKRAAYV